MNGGLDEAPRNDVSLLIVDDDPGAIHLLRRALSSYGDVRFATSGVEGLRLAAEFPPDLVLLDAEMPDMSGLELCRAFKSDPRLAPVPLIFVTSHGGGELEALALDQGAADFLSKPVVATQVCARVRAQLRLRELDRSRRHLTERLELALAAGRLGAWEWWLETDQLIWHASMASLRGDSAARVQRFRDHLLGLAPEDQARLRTTVESSLKTGRGSSTEYGVRVGDDRRQLKSRLLPVLDDRGQISRIVGIDQDITDAHRASTQQGSANRQLEQFAYFAAHELQAPARQMAAFASLAREQLAAGRLGELDEFLGQIEQAGQRMRQQIHSFLDLARHRLSEPGEWSHRPMSELVQRVWSELATEAAEHGARLQLQALSPAYVPVNLIAHVWRKLLLDGIRRHGAGSPLVQVGEQASEYGLAYYVEHAGPEPAAASGESGTGLGLELCQKVVQVLGGRLWHAPGPQGGVRVLFTLGQPPEPRL